MIKEKKKAILLVSFGTIYLDALKKSIEKIENRFQLHFPEHEVRRAFTSQPVIKRLFEQLGIKVDNVEEALDKLVAQGYEEVFIQPIYLVADKIYNQLKENLIKITKSKPKPFKNVTIGRPLLYSLGLKKHPDDYNIVIEAIKKEMPCLGAQRALVFMCNGSMQLEYAVLQLKLIDSGLANVFVCVAEGYPTLDSVIGQLRKNGFTEVLLAPFVLVASEHLLDYMAGDHPDSLKSKMEEAGFKVAVYSKGLGENKEIQAIYIKHLQDSMLAATLRHGRKKSSGHEE